MSAAGPPRSPPSSASPLPASPQAAKVPQDTPQTLALFQAELDLVDLNARQIARRLGTGTVTLDDLRSFGREGLLSAARSFDATRGVPFRRWANLRIRGAIIDGVRQWGSLPRRVHRELRALSAADHLQEACEQEDAAKPASTADEADARITQYLAGIATAMAVGTIAAEPVYTRDGQAESPSRDPSPEDATIASDLGARLRAAVAELPDQERTLVERHYFGEQTLDQAAASLGLSKSWGSRLHARAIERIGRELRRKGVA